jgi:hypothetical protein
MSWLKKVGTPKQAKKTFGKIVKEEIDDKRNDRVAQQRAKRNNGGKK